MFLCVVGMDVGGACLVVIETAGSPRDLQESCPNLEYRVLVPTCVSVGRAWLFQSSTLLHRRIGTVRDIRQD